MNKQECLRYYQDLQQAVKSQHGKLIFKFIEARIDLLQEGLQDGVLSPTLIDDDEAKRLNRIKQERLALNSLLFGLSEQSIQDKLDYLNEVEDESEEP